MTEATPGRSLTCISGFPWIVSTLKYFDVWHLILIDTSKLKELAQWGCN